MENFVMRYHEAISFFQNSGKLICYAAEIISVLCLMLILLAAMTIFVPMMLSLGYFLLIRSKHLRTLKIMRIIKWVIIVPAWMIASAIVYYVIFGEAAFTIFVLGVVLVAYIIGCFCNGRWEYKHQDDEKFYEVLAQPNALRTWWRQWVRSKDIP